MKRISIVSLIYKSTKYADFVYSSIHRHTKELEDGTAEFFFVANDATENVLEHLKTKGYKYYNHVNHPKTDEELFKIGIGWPNYLHGVYKAWNQAIIQSDSELVCLVNSDMAFTPNWLSNLLKHVDKNIVVGSKLVERSNGRWRPFINPVTGSRALVQNLGSSPNDFNEPALLEYAKVAAVDKLEPGGAYMPILFKKEAFVNVGLYPEGNIHDGRDFNRIVEYGDQNIMRKLRESGVGFMTACDSIVYHFKEGEMDE